MRMFDWLNFQWISREHILNGLLTDAISTGFEALFIVKLLEWRGRREENRRLRGCRQRTRNLLRRSLAQTMENLNDLLKRSARYRSQSVAMPATPLPAPAALVRLLSVLKHTHDDLGRDYVGRLPLLDDPLREILDAWLEQMESLFATWPIRRMIQPDFLSEWGRFEDDGDRAVILGLQEAEVELLQRALIAESVDGKLLHAETNRSDGDLLNEASAIRDGSHYWLKSKSQIAEMRHLAVERGDDVKEDAVV